MTEDEAGVHKAAQVQEPAKQIVTAGDGMQVEEPATSSSAPPPATTMNPVSAAPVVPESSSDNSLIRNTDVPAAPVTVSASSSVNGNASDMDAAIAATLSSGSNPESSSSAAALPSSTSGPSDPPQASTSGTSPPPRPVPTSKPATTSIFMPAQPKAAAPKSRVEQLSLRIERDTLDADARLALIAHATSKGDLERAREAYEDFLRVFPDAADQWIAYADLELQHGLFSNAEALFARCLRLSTSVKLWKFYIDYIRRVNPVDASDAQSAREARSIITKSFEFALAHIGQDREAGDVWLSYISFLREGQNRGTVEDQQRMDAVRKTYQRAVCIPVNNVETIWQEYNAFENSLSKMTAKKFVSELSPSYMTARKALREMKAVFDQLPMPSIPHQPHWSTREDRKGLESWKRYFAWEEANPLDFEDMPTLQSRVSYVYKKATAHLRFFSEVWFLASQYQMKIGKIDEARALLRSGLEANPTSLMLAFNLAELEESKQDYPAVYAIYDRLIDIFKLSFGQIEAMVETETSSALEAFDQTTAQADAAKKEDDEEADETVQKRTQEREQIKDTVRSHHQPAIDSLKLTAANVWIAEMRFARRAEGVKQARTVFSKARKAPHLAWQVIEASALMELHWNNDAKVATNVFELGLKLFPNDVDFILRYLDFLISSNNPNNARALFEKSVTTLEASKARPIWDRMLAYEAQFGDFLAAKKINDRFAEAFPDVSATDRFVQRHSYDGLDESIRGELGIDVPVYTGRGRRRRLSKQEARSPSPLGQRAGGATAKRNLPDDSKPTAIERAGAMGGVATAEAKRLRTGDRNSPQPVGQTVAGPPSGGRGKRGLGLDDGGTSDAGSRKGTPPVSGGSPAVNIGGGGGGPLSKLDHAGHTVARLPEPILYFLSVLPSVSSFNGPAINPMTLIEVMQSANLPMPGAVGPPPPSGFGPGPGRGPGGPPQRRWGA